MTKYPFVPRSNTHLEPGHLWSIPLPDGRFGCGRVVAVDRNRSYGARILFTGALLDWVSEEVPSADAIAGRAVLGFGTAHVRVIGDRGGMVVGFRPLELDGIDPPARVDTHWGSGFPEQRLARRFIEGDPPPAMDRRVAASPLTEAMLRPSPTGRGVVQFSSLLTDDDFRRLADWMAGYPGMELRAYGSYDGSIRDLEFLRFFPTLRGFAADALWDRLTSIDGLRHLPEQLDYLGLGATRRPMDLGILGRFRALRGLYLERQTKGIEVVSTLTSLEELTLRSITLPDLRLLLPLTGLQSLDLKLGGTRDLRLLPQVGALRYLELWLIRGLADVDVIGRLPTLRSVFLQALPQVTTLPDLASATSLRRVHLQGMRGLRDLSPLATAPRLQEVLLLEMPHLDPRDLLPLAGLPLLRAVTLGLGVRRSREAAALLGLPPVETAFDWRAD